MVFWQSKQPIRRIFWEGCGGKKYTTKHSLVHSQAEKMVPHPPFPVKPSSAWDAFCYATCACRALLSSAGSESPCRGRRTPLQRSATSFSKGSVQQQARMPGVSPYRISWRGRQASAVAQEQPWLGVCGGLCWAKQRGTRVCRDTELWGDARAGKGAGSSAAWLVWHGLMSPCFSPEGW